jgi:DNA-binding MurR/RpiR family transcriptional regulator
LRQAGSSLSKAERKIARVLHSTNLRAGLQPVSLLARAAESSGPTVLRFIKKLGFKSFPAFQTALRSEVSQRTKSPRAQLASSQEPLGDREFLRTARFQLIASLEATFDAIPERDFERAARLLGDRRRQIVVLGGRFTQLFAEYLVGRLYQLRPNVRLAGGPSIVISRNEDLPTLPRSAVLVVFDLRRYQVDSIEFARAAAERGVTIILVTDTWLSPIADFAAIVFPIHIETNWHYDSFANCAVLVELLFGKIVSQGGTEVLERIRLLESFQSGLLD